MIQSHLQILDLLFQQLFPIKVISRPYLNSQRHSNSSLNPVSLDQLHVQPPVPSLGINKTETYTSSEFQ